MNYQEITKDLFTIGEEYALAHCISQDCALGAGIAKEFRRRYPNMPKKIYAAEPNIGDAVIYEGNYTVFNLITKEKYWHKPTRETFDKSIESLKEELVSRKIKKLSIPQIGAGLDRLDWNENRAVIQRIFEDTDIEIVVCIWK